MTAALAARDVRAGWLRDALWRRARAVPSFDIDANYSATPIDRISGQNLTTFTRAASATYVDVDGVIRTAGANVLRRQWDATNQRWGWLVEEARTNLLLNTVWSGAVGGSPGTAPTSWSTGFGTGAQTSLVSSINGSADGAQAVRFDADATERIMYQQSINVTNGVQYAISVYVEAVSGNIGDAMTITAGTATATINTTVSSPLTPGRYTMLVTATGTGTLNIRFGIGTTTGAGGTCSVTMSRPQVEAGAFPTSYIPTTSATATRDADVWTVTGSNFSRWYRQSEGTVFALSAAAPGSVGVLAEFRNANPADAPSIFSRYFGNSTRIEVPSNNDYTGRTAQLSYTPQSINKYAGAYKDNDSAIAVNGLAPATALLNTIGKNGNALTIGANRLCGDVMNTPISRLTYWPARLSNPTLQELTR